MHAHKIIPPGLFHWANQDPQTIRDMARFLESAAAELRIIADIVGNEDRTSLRATFLRKKSAKIAYALIQNGQEREGAIKSAALSIRYRIAPQMIEASLKSLEQELEGKKAAARDKKIQTLSRQGKPIREIANIVGLSKTRVSRILLDNAPKTIKKQSITRPSKREINHA